jgi:peptidoglycan/xylan/chitin deacetylase (PgdA/CDA1 family)
MLRAHGQPRFRSSAEDRSPLPKLYFLYHELSEAPSRSPYSLTTKQFHAHASVFAEMRTDGNQCFWPEVTFDDGHSSNLTLALPILREYGLGAMFFITVGWIDRKAGYLGWADLKILRDSGQQFGSHGWSHAFLTDCRDDQLRREVLDSRLMLEDKLGVEIRTMACPGGRFNSRVISACKDAGYLRVYTSVPEPERLSSSFLVGRVNAHPMMRAEDVRELIAPDGKALRNLKRRYRVKAALKSLLTDRVYDALWWKLAGNREVEATDLVADEDSPRN